MERVRTEVRVEEMDAVREGVKGLFKERGGGWRRDFGDGIIGVEKEQWTF